MLKSNTARRKVQNSVKLYFIFLSIKSSKGTSADHPQEPVYWNPESETEGCPNQCESECIAQVTQAKSQTVSQIKANTGQNTAD